MKKQIAEIREENIIQLEKFREAMDFKVSSFISEQERDVKIFMTSVNKQVDEKVEQTKIDMKTLINQEIEYRETQVELIKSTIEHNQIQLTEKIEEYKCENIEMGKVSGERICSLNEKIIKNSRTIALVNREVEDIMKKNDRVIEEVADIKNKIDTNVTSVPVIATHMPNIRINIPTFSGNNNTTMAPHFLNTLEEYFAITNVHKSQWMTYLGQAFQGSAIAWFRQVKPTCLNWDIFKEKFLENYHGPVQRMRYAAQVEESKQRIDEKAEAFIWRINDVIKLVYPYLKEEEIVMCVLRKMKCGFGVLIRDNIKTILDLVQKANEMEEVIKIDGRSNNSSSEDSQNQSKSNNQYSKQQGQYNQQSNKQNNDRGWQNNGYRPNNNNSYQNRTPRGDNGGNNTNYYNNQSGPSQNDTRDSQPVQVAVVNKGKGVGKKSPTHQDTNTARNQHDGNLNGQGGGGTAGQAATPSTST